MYVYDQARSLARAIRESQEYKLLKRQKGKIQSDPHLNKMFTDYRAKQFDIHKMQYTGQAIPDEKMKAFKDLHEIAAANPVIKEFLEIEHRFGTMMADIQKILIEGLDLGG